MINLLLCGNEKVFDGALTELISITNRTQEAIKCYIFTAELTRIKPEYTAINEEQVKFLDKVVKQKNSKNQVIRIDVTDIYEEQFKKLAPDFHIFKQKISLSSQYENSINQLKTLREIKSNKVAEIQLLIQEIDEI